MATADGTIKLNSWTEISTAEEKEGETECRRKKK